MKTLYTAILLLFVTTTAVQGWWRIVNHRVTATGTVKCKLDGRYQPLPYVKVELHDDDAIINDKMAVGRTDVNGNFRLSGTGRDHLSGKPDPMIRVIYEYSGTYGQMDVENVFGSNYYGDSWVIRDSTTANFNSIHFNNENCRAYLRLYREGLKYYYYNVKRTAPYGKLRINTKSILAHIGGVPYASHTKIKIPSRADPISAQTARHEFGHTIRHHYDGSFSHFLWDATRFWYARNHYCSKRTNYGFAFNEGWAQYWSGQCTG